MSEVHRSPPPPYDTIMPREVRMSDGRLSTIYHSDRVITSEEADALWRAGPPTGYGEPGPLVQGSAPEEHEWDAEENGEKQEADFNGLELRSNYGDSVDFRIESSNNDTILELSPGGQETYFCPAHGNVTETIKFDIEGENEIYCMRCWRDWFRNSVHMTRLERSVR